MEGLDVIAKLVKEKTLRSLPAIKKALQKEVDNATFGKIVMVCGGDRELANRLKPFAYLLRTDAWGDFIVYRAHSFAVTLGADRRETGTHYTPKSLTESIVETTLEPVAYFGPAKGKPRDEWQLKSSAELLELKICDPAMGSGAFLVQVCRWLSERLVEAWGKEQAQGLFITVDGEAIQPSSLSLHPSGEPMPDSLDERLLIARRLVAEKCLYGVDLNPLAVELAKLSIWLITLAKGRPFGFLDHNLRSGDSLLGLTELEQLTKFSPHPEKKQIISSFASNIEAAVKDALALRKQLRKTQIRDIRDIQYMEQLDRAARQKLEHIEHIANTMIGEALTSGGNQRSLDTTIDNLSIWAAAYVEGNNETGRKIVAEARKSLSIDLPAGKPPRKPFHWALKFPEVFERGGFDGIVGNPPFMGGQKITGALGICYRNYLVEHIAKGKRGSADLVAYFFIRANTLLFSKGSYGLIAVNTIGEGNTREVGLDSILASGSSIYNTTPNVIWPGKANVVTSSVHITKDKWKGAKYINQDRVETISAALTERENWHPVKLVQNKGIVFQGVITRGTGFILDKHSALKLLKDDDNANDVIYQYIIGKDVNGNSSIEPGRWVINFWDWSEKKASFYPEAYRIVSNELKKDRWRKNESGKYICAKPLRKKWWLYEGRREGLFHAIGRGHNFQKHPVGWDPAQQPLDKVIVFATGATKYPCFTLVPNTYIYANTLCVIASQSFSLFACLSSDVHTVWAWEYCSKMKQDMRYTHGDIFETFPFPEGVLEGDAQGLAQLGEQFFNLRSQYMKTKDKGMTKFYNDLHNPACQTDEIQILRDLQIQINRAVIDLYGWDKLDLCQDFHEVSYLPAGKNIRFTIKEEARNELLYRLSLLNKKRYEEEVAQGLHDKKKKKTSPPPQKENISEQK